MACLDTTFLIDLSRKSGSRRIRAREKLEELVISGECLTTTRFNVAELNVGVFRSGDMEKEKQAVLCLLENISILEFDDTAALIFARLTASFQEIGRPVGDMDVLIAATALAWNEPNLITRNPKHFTNIRGLIVQGY